jgi:hypothetical protein
MSKAVMDHNIHGAEGGEAQGDQDNNSGPLIMGLGGMAGVGSSDGKGPLLLPGPGLIGVGNNENNPNGLRSSGDGTAGSSKSIDHQLQLQLPTVDGSGHGRPNSHPPAHDSHVAPQEQRHLLGGDRGTEQSMVYFPSHHQGQEQNYSEQMQPMIQHSMHPNTYGAPGGSMDHPLDQGQHEQEYQQQHMQAEAYQQYLYHQMMQDQQGQNSQQESHHHQDFEQQQQQMYYQQDQSHYSVGDENNSSSADRNPASPEQPDPSAA